MASRKKAARKPPPESRNSGLTRAIIAEICKLIRAGNYRETAAAAAGVHSRTMRHWLKKGADDLEAGRRTLEAQLSVEMDLAEAQAEATDVALIKKAGRNDWRAAADRLAKRHPKRWGQQVRVKVEAELENFLRVAEGVLEAEAFGRLLEALAAQDGEEAPD